MSLFAAADGGVLFILLAPFWAVGGGYFLSYAIHSLLVVLEQTGAGADEVVWPDDGIREWLAKALYWAWLVLLWLIPISLASAWLDYQSLLPLLILLLTVFFWLVWPVSLMSSLSSISGWTPVRWEVLKRLPRCWLPWAVFYVITAPLFLLTIGLFWFVLLGVDPLRELAEASTWAALPDVVDIAGVVLFLPMGGLMAAALFLIYSRLLGRLAFALRLAQQQEFDEAAAGEEATGEEPAEPAPAEGEPAVATPVPAQSAEATAESPAAGESKPETYALVNEPPPAVPAATPFRWQPGRTPPPRPPRSQWRDRPNWTGPTDGSDVEAESPAANSIHLILSRSVFLFPWYRASIRPWLWLAVGFAFLCALARFQISIGGF